ncbi:MAG: DegV family EDD domain-containing protein [Oscillospiraceae bacterium]|nr:DegV family EDD domain-containing protein [Oscillospiraceae bacterium]
MTKQIAITGDSTADLPPRLRAQVGLETVPMRILLEGKTCLDGVDIAPEDILEAHRLRRAIPMTAAPPPEAFKSFFEGFTRRGEAVVHVTINHKYSACHQNAVLGAREAEGEVHVVDSLNFSVSQGLLCLHAHRLREEGLAAQQIAARLTRLREKVWGVYYLDALDFISKSGRCPGVLALGANLLGLHPAVQFHGDTGGQTIGKKYRGKDPAGAWLRDTARRFLGECDSAECYLVHTADIAPEARERMYALALELLQPYVGRLELEGRVGGTTTAHCGGGCFGLVGMEK